MKKVYYQWEDAEGLIHESDVLLASQKAADTFIEQQKEIMNLADLSFKVIAVLDW